jgi:hypothetical protein
MFRVSFGEEEKANSVLLKKNTKYIALNDQSVGGELTHKINMEINTFLLLLHSMNISAAMRRKRKFQ